MLADIPDCPASRISLRSSGLQFVASIRAGGRCGRRLRHIVHRCGFTDPGNLPCGFGRADEPKASLFIRRTADYAPRVRLTGCESRSRFVFYISRKLEAREWRHGPKTTNDPVGRADARPGASAWRVAGSQRSGVGLCLAGHVCGDCAQGRGRQAACALPGRADHQPRSRRGTSVRGHGYGGRAVLHGRGHQPDRARRHRFDDLQPALRSRPALCDGGSPVQGTGRLERRDDGPRGRRRNVRPGHTPGSAGALQPRRRISRGRHQALGKLGAGRPRRRQGQRGLCRPRRRSIRFITPARTSRCAGRCPSPVRVRAGR